jgi:hypothetical protein
MALSIDKAMRLQFDLASLRQIARGLTTAEDWRRADRIKQRSQTLRTEAKDRYEHKRGWRVTAERSRLIDEAGIIHHALKPGFARADGFDPERTRQAAERIVRLRHEARINGIDRAEANMLGRLVRETAAPPSEQTHETFARHARDGPSRKGPKQD